MSLHKLDDDRVYVLPVTPASSSSAWCTCTTRKSLCSTLAACVLGVGTVTLWNAGTPNSDSIALETKPFAERDLTAAATAKEPAHTCADKGTAEWCGAYATKKTCEQSTVKGHCCKTCIAGNEEPVVIVHQATKGCVANAQLPKLKAACGQCCQPKQESPCIPMKPEASKEDAESVCKTVTGELFTDELTQWVSFCQTQCNYKER